MTKLQEIRLQTFLERIISSHGKYMPDDENASNTNLIKLLANRSKALQDAAIEALDLLGTIWPDENN
jgi:hypothetical protein